jgi:DNA-directed RNA polymerase specialized sigma24 family protein
MEHTGEPLIDDHVGLITQLCIRSWRTLPPSARYLYDVEDLVSGAFLQVYRQRKRYNRGRAKSSTFVHRIVTNYCIDTQRKIARRVELLSNEEALTVATVNDNERSLLEARELCERLVGSASAKLRWHLAHFARTRHQWDWEPDLIAELRVLVAQLNIKPQELQLVLTNVL